MALLKALRISFIPLLVLLSACGGGGNGGGTGNRIHIADMKPTVDCSNPVTLNTSYRINGLPVLQDGLGGAINFTNVTLEPICYLIGAQLNIPDNVQLVIPPRTVMMFDTQNAGLTVLGGSIIARGTPNAPIFFTGSGEIKNNWAGIRVYKRNLNEIIFDYTIIEYAGSKGRFISTKAAFAILHHTDNTGQIKGRLTFNNNVIRSTAQSSDYALLAENFSYFNDFSNNTIYDNPVNPISITFNEVHLINNNNQFTHGGISNKSNKIVVSRPLNGTFQNLDTSNSPSADFEKSITWRAHTIPYLIKDKVRITHSTLNIEAGAELQFEESAGISVENSDAILSAIGNPARPIIFTKADPPTNSWQGIQFTNANSFENKLNFVDINYGGGNNVLNANLILKSNSNVHVSNSNIQSSLFGYGIYVDDTSTFNSFSNNSISGNFLGAGLVAASALRYLDTSSNYINNTNNYIEVLNPTKGIGSAATIPGINAPYAFFEEFPINGKLTIEPGAILLFAQGRGMTIKDNLTAEGTQSKPILFSALENNTGAQNYWRGLLFDSSEGSLNNVTVEYAGYSANPTFTRGAGIRLNSSNSFGSFVQINNTTVEKLNSGAVGVYVETRSEVIGNPSSNFIDNGTFRESDSF